MEVKFKESKIPEDLSKALASQNMLLGPTMAEQAANILFVGTSRCLADNKDLSVPKAVVFRRIDGSFLVAAKLEYIKNPDDPADLASGQWNYSWTFDEEDIKDCKLIETTNNLITMYFYNAASSLYSIKFNDPSVCATVMNLVVEMIINWIKENTKDGDKAVLTLGGVFTAMGEVVDGEIQMAIIPDGEIKILIKDDAAIQG